MITLKAPDQQHYLSVNSQGLLVAEKLEEDDSCQFEVEDLGDGYFVLKSNATQKYVSFLDTQECAARGVAQYSIMATAEYIDIWEKIRVGKFRYGMTINCSYWGKYLSVQNYGGGAVLGNGPEAADWEVIVSSDYSVFNLSGGGTGPVIPGNVKKLQGEVRTINRSFGDNSGPRYIHICTDFGGFVKYHEDRDACLRTLDIVAQHQQGIRAAYRLNGGYWTDSGLTIDPIRDGWWEETVDGYVRACNDRGLKIDLMCADMYNWSDQQAEDNIRRLGQICAGISHDVVLVHEWNEMRGTWPGGEEDTAKLQRLAEVWESVYPWALNGGSDPGDQARDGMKALSPGPCNIGLVHNTRWYATDGIRRAFNIIYENYPDEPVMEGEPTGPEDPAPDGGFNRLVYQPIEDYNDLAAIYSMHIFTGQISTYFSDPSLASRRPLDETWGFKELPKLWQEEMEVPEDIGQGTPLHGGRAEAPVNVIDSNADRADTMTCPNGWVYGAISGQNGNWKVKSKRDGQLTCWQGNTRVHDGHISNGETIPISGPTATTFRIR